MMTASIEKAAWIREAMERYQGPLVRYAVHLTGRLETARDVVQDTFFRLCEADRAAVEGHLSAWLYRVCRNRAFDVQRKDRPMRPLSDGMLESRPADVPTPAGAVEQHQSSSRLRELMGTLPQRQQEVLRLKFEEDLSYREIAEVTGQSVTNVGFLIHRAMKTLREAMEAGKRQPARSMP